MEYEHIEHTFAPVYDADSKVLILGTLPSVKSRENHFYYGHKQNRFWKVVADLCGEPVPETIEEKKAMLLAHHIAIWDVIQSCDIKGSSDSSIRNVEPTDIRRMLAESKITGIYANGNKAGSLSSATAAHPINYIENIRKADSASLRCSCPLPVLRMRHGPCKNCVKPGEIPLT